MQREVVNTLLQTPQTPAFQREQEEEEEKVLSVKGVFCFDMC
jgi:hypothetical protein